MIRFGCPCGEKFEVPESLAGDSFQCPRCRRLVDVPMLSDLQAINEDGTLKLTDAEPVRPELARKMQVFSHRDDLRNTPDDLLGVGADPSEGVPHRHSPRYDPETGELVVPIDLRADPAIDHPEDIPMASPVLGYSNAAAPNAGKRQTLRWWAMPWHLLTGLSLMAMLFVFLAHVAVDIMLLIPGFNILLLLPALAIVIATIAHYCNTVEEIGPHDMDDVPVYLRSVSLSEDILHPFYAFAISAIYALIPLWLALAFGMRPIFESHPWVLNAFLGLAGLVFPAILFTAICSGALQNLMPQRIASVVIAAPAQYALATAAFWAACVAYAGAFSQMDFASIAVLQTAGGHMRWGPLAAHVGTVYAFFGIAIYLMHLGAAWLGLIYRTHYEKFNWVLQRHEPKNRNASTPGAGVRQPRQLTPAAQARLAHVRQADAERRQPTGSTEAVPFAQKMPKPTRGFEV